jgi:S-(hydroxymethyl)glutathione dehydrogenase / alcohol dehydrogenase
VRTPITAALPPSSATRSSASCRRWVQCPRVEQTRRRERPKLLPIQGDEITVLGDLGGFAEAFLASERSLAKLPQGLDPAVACLLGCCVSAGVGSALHGAKITAEDTVAVIGCGGVGIAAIQGASPTWLGASRVPQRR